MAEPGEIILPLLRSSDRFMAMTHSLPLWGYAVGYKSAAPMELSTECKSCPDKSCDHLLTEINGTKFDEIKEAQNMA